MKFSVFLISPDVLYEAVKACCPVLSSEADHCKEPDQEKEEVSKEEFWEKQRERTEFWDWFISVIARDESGQYLKCHRQHEMATINIMHEKTEKTQILSSENGSQLNGKMWQI